MLERFLENLYLVFLDMSVYIMLGLFIVGILNSFVDKQKIKNQIGNNSLWSVIKASLIGVPLPLCSCGVVPTAVELKKLGGSNGAVVSFLVSTPQTGVDSIVATWGMLGPFMAFFRAIAAFISGIVSGIAVNIFGKDVKINTPTGGCGCGCEEEAVKVESSCGCGCEEEVVKVESSCGCGCEEPSKASNGDFATKFKKVFTYGFGSFLDEIAGHFIVGILISALISTVIPEDFFISYGLDGGIMSMLLMVLVGLPMYICSTSSIPVALSLVMKGLSPGAAFVFLFTGPVSNMASIIVIAKALGKKITAIYISSVVILAVLFGLLLDVLVVNLGVSFSQNASHAHGENLPWYYLVLGAIFFLLLIKSAVKNLSSGKTAHSKPVKT